MSARLEGMLAFITAGSTKLESSSPKGIRTGKPVLGLTKVGVALAVVQRSQGRFARKLPVDSGGEDGVHAGDGWKTGASSKTPNNYGLDR